MRETRFTNGRECFIDEQGWRGPDTDSVSSAWIATEDAWIADLGSFSDKSTEHLVMSETFQVTTCMGHYGIIFNSNRELLRNYHAEKRFELHHYTCAGCFVSMVTSCQSFRCS